MSMDTRKEVLFVLIQEYAGLGVRAADTGAAPRVWRMGTAIRSQNRGCR
ncbi:Uncharacterised protein [Klebsiella michiganensis]|uniref:Uncharacterized protein n=1 Tax=Klebsiella michiganensis TaxID=1134687 RepID=A0A7H4MZ24_9ENTR|nr:Uncharacterised protein [Klebsiella michiganensis]